MSLSLTNDTGLTSVLAPAPCRPGGRWAGRRRSRIRRTQWPWWWISTPQSWSSFRGFSFLKKPLLLYNEIPDDFYLMEVKSFITMTRRICCLVWFIRLSFISGICLFIPRMENHWRQIKIFLAPTGAQEVTLCVCPWYLWILHSIFMQILRLVR